MANLCWAVLVVLLGGILIAGGCEKKDVKLDLVSADIDIYSGPTRTLVQKQLHITDPLEVEQLASFFPHFGQGKRSSKAGGWAGMVEIHFTCKDGKKLKIMTDYELWSEGPGDWPVSPGLWEYLSHLLQQQK